MKEINLTQGKVALVDDEDYEFINQWKWCAQKIKYTYYAERKLPRVKGQPRKAIRMHRLLMEAKGHLEIVDHRDHDGLNNQKSNLRLCDHGVNNHNRTKISGTLSKYTGVIFDRASGTWTARIKYKGKSVSLKYHKTEIEAAMAYAKKAVELYGDLVSPLLKDLV